MWWLSQDLCKMLAELMNLLQEHRVLSNLRIYQPWWAWRVTRLRYVMNKLDDVVQTNLTDCHVFRNTE